MKGSAATYVLIAGAVTVLGGVARGRGIEERPIIATGALGVVAIAAESVNAQLTRTLAAALMITALLTSGVQVATGLSNLTGGTAT